MRPMRTQILQASLATAGPIGVGAVLAARLHDPATLIAVPVVVGAVTALTVPGLYIGMAVVGAAPPMPRVIRAVGAALFALGVAMAGLALPLGFLVATAASGTAFALGALCVAAGAGIGLRVLHRELFEGELEVAGRGLLFLMWAAIALVIGARLFGELTAEVLR